MRGHPVTGGSVLCKLRRNSVGSQQLACSFDVFTTFFELSRGSPAPNRASPSAFRLSLAPCRLPLAASGLPLPLPACRLLPGSRRLNLPRAVCSLLRAACRFPLAACRLQLAAGTCRWPLATGCLPLAACRLPFAACRLPLAACRSPPAATCLLRAVCCSLRAACCLPLATEISSHAGSTAFWLQRTSDQACGAENSSERRFSSRSTWIAQNLKRFLRCFRLPAGFIADGFRRFSGSNGLRIRRPGLKRCQKGAVPSSRSPFRSSFLAGVGRSLDFFEVFRPPGAR